MKRFVQWFKKRRGSRKPDLILGRTDDSQSIHKLLLLAIGLVVVTLLVMMFPKGQSLQYTELKEGSISPRRIVAPFNFEILKTTEEYQRDRELATRDVYPVFNEDREKIDGVLHDLQTFWQSIRASRKKLIKNPEKEDQFVDSLKAQYDMRSVTNNQWKRLIRPYGDISEQVLKQIESHTKIIVQDLLSIGILNLEKQRFAQFDNKLIVSSNNEEKVFTFDDFYEQSESIQKAAEMLNEMFDSDRDLIQLSLGILGYFLRPNIIYDEPLHQARMNDEMARVPLSSGFVYENEKIVDRNERVTPEIRKKLISLSTKMVEMGMEEGGIKRLFPYLGRVSFLIILFFFFVSVIRWEYVEILRSLKLSILVSLVVLLIAFSAFFVHKLETSEYIIPTAAGAMLFATLFDRRIGFGGAVFLSLLVGALWGNDYNLMFISFFTSIAGVLIIKKVRNRSQWIRVLVYLAGMYVLSITVMGLMRYQSMHEIMKQWPYGALNGFFTPILIYGLLPLIESIFKITTDFTLLELSNFNHPLLKRLSLQAPGTYHHSIMVGNLAETAAQAIGANSLLARVGSYYHDIGKIEKAEYFMENQMGGENPHERLLPRMSALILINHVKRGLEFAEQNKLPKAIKDIIGQHQGSTVMPFFYQKAVQKSDDVNEDDYRYPGPKPQTKEAAIVMLADVVEAASRALKDPTHSRLKGLVNDLIDERFKEGQLNDSPLTLRDLERIKSGFMTILAGTFHTRIEYPEKEELKHKKETKGRKNHAVES